MGSRIKQRRPNFARHLELFLRELWTTIVDEDTFPYRCVKGKAKARVSDDPSRNLSIVQKMVIKYLGDLDHPFSRQMIDQIKRGDSVVIELTPAYYSAWDFGQD
jgi:hypothetical protein